MTRITPGQAAGRPDDKADEASEEAFHPLSAEEARQWRSEHPQLSVTRVLFAQLATGLLVVGLAWLWTRQAAAAASAAYGMLVAVLPAALSARGMARWARPGFPPMAALLGFFLWEGVKLVLAVGLLVAAPRVLGVPHWPALLISLVLTMKVYWVGLLLAGSRRGGVAKTHAEINTNGC